MPCERTKSGWAAVVLTSIGLVSWGGAGRVSGQEQPKAPSRAGDPAARALFEQVADAYKALQSYSDHGEFVVAMTLAGKPRRDVRPLRLAFARPNKLELDAGAVRLVSDGKTMTTVVEPLKKTISGPAPETMTIDTFREGPTGAILFGGPTASPMFVLLNLVSGTNPDVLLDQIGGTIRSDDSEKKGTGPAAAPASLVIDRPDGADLRLRIDPATGLLSAIEMKVDPSQVTRLAGPGQTLTIEQFGWKSGAISTQLPADRSFTFVSPRGFIAMDAPKGAPHDAAPAPRFVAEERLGKPAPEFTLTVLDGPGKMRTLSKADLAGKVVVLDFWATWCEPCLVELPEIQKLVEQYKASAKEVLIIALSQDSVPEEISEVRKLVEKTLADKKIDLIGGPVGRIGLDPSNSVGQAFDVEGLPTLVILDGKGTIQAVHIGLSADTKETLAKRLTTEIDSLLAGKPLVGGQAPGAGQPKVEIRQVR